MGGNPLKTLENYFARLANDKLRRELEAILRERFPAKSCIDTLRLCDEDPLLKELKASQERLTPQDRQRAYEAATRNHVEALLPLVEAVRNDRCSHGPLTQQEFDLAQDRQLQAQILDMPRVLRSAAIRTDDPGMTPETASLQLGVADAIAALIEGSPLLAARQPSHQELLDLQHNIGLLLFNDYYAHLLPPELVQIVRQDIPL